MTEYEQALAALQALPPGSAVGVLREYKDGPFRELLTAGHLHAAFVLGHVTAREVLDVLALARQAGES